MKQLTIIIPHYNTPLLLQKLLDSIPDIPEIEVIVIDDNSDREKKLFLMCKERNKNRNIIFLENFSGNKGAGNARNIGLRQANGKWILFADADDFFVKNFWNTLKDYMNDDSRDIVYFKPTSVKLNALELSDRHIYYEKLVSEYCFEPSHINEIKLRYAFWSPCSKLIRKEIIDKNNIRFDGTLHSNDVMFSAKVGFFAKKISSVDKVIYCITQSENSLTAQKDDKSLEIRKHVFCNYYFFLHKRLPRQDMQILNFSMKDFLYFTFLRMKYILCDKM